MTTSPSAVALAPSEIAVLARAVSRAPSVHNTQPWRLRIHYSDADLVERTEIWLPRHDPDGRDRTMSCGAALAHLQPAARVLRRCGTTSFPRTGAVVATVRADPGASPDSVELVRYHAISRRRSHRRWFAGNEVSEVDCSAVAAAAGEPGVRAVVPGHLDALGEMLGFATRVFRADPAYQRELWMWIAHTCGFHGLGAEDGVPEGSLSDEALPAAGLVRPDTPVPDDARVTKRLRPGRFLVFCTDRDTRPEHLAAGAAVERTWVEAAARGLVGSVLTQPLHLLGFRELLAERLELPGRPQAIFRFSHPADPVPPLPRRPLTDLLPGDFPGTGAEPDDPPRSTL
ncbi:nitroreductase [Amycolatopsis sp. FDAARGOS 1241]|uniref:nitroreductase n=1 Tax=Amycolatopsis sp. FDAARGOS 1241 TaxID=2778070 RepID=UPI00194F94A3|nr:nitroreductase [Amycolatopsis sp. FDAARGOS 1241]QRP42919.1 nitroreductase [Amycolatopsis sp. FDAARGOS 1241]